MRIEECFTLFQEATKYYDINLQPLSFTISESDTPDYLLCDIARVIGRYKHKNSKTIADIIAVYLPFKHVVLDNGDIKFYLWQEVIS